MKLPLLSAKEVVKILEKIGFEKIRQKGSHKYFRRADGRVTIVPMHSGKDIGRGLLRRILKEIDISCEEFIKLL